MSYATALLTGVIVGVAFAVARQPIPAPPTIPGVLGILGILFGYRLAIAVLAWAAR